MAQRGREWRQTQTFAPESRVAGVAALISALALVASQGRQFTITSAVHVTAQDPIAPYLANVIPRFQFTGQGTHYDGTYYLAMALDPLARGTAHTLIDLAPYRYGHPLYSWLTWLLSGAHPPLMPWILALLNLVAMTIATWAGARLLTRAGLTPWLALIVSAHPGLLFAVANDTSEPLSVALLLLLLVHWRDGRIDVDALALLSGLLAFAKEPNVLVLVAAALLLTVRAIRRPEERSAALRRVAAALLGPVLLVGWYLYVRHTFGQAPNDYETGNLGVPFLGLLDTLQRAGWAQVSGEIPWRMMSVTPPLLIMYATLYAVALRVLFRSPSLLSAAAATQIAISVCMGWRTALFPQELLRLQAVPTVLAVLAIALSMASRKETARLQS